MVIVRVMSSPTAGAQVEVGSSVVQLIPADCVAVAIQLLECGVDSSELESWISVLRQIKQLKLASYT